VLDFRSTATKKAAKQRHPKKPIRLVQWNIERGYKLKEVIEELKSIDGDIISLQEVSKLVAHRHKYRLSPSNLHRAS